MLDNIDLTALISDYGVPWAINIGMALLIFVVGRMVVSAVVGLIRKLMTRANVDQMLVGFICSIVRWVLLLFVIVASLDQLGVDTTSLIAIVGAAGLAIGLSLQDSLKNFASGVLLIIFRPFTQGNFVAAAGEMGVVDKIGIFTTTLVTVDNKEIIIPNAAIYSGNITNFSARDTRRVDMVFGVSYDDDIRVVKTELEKIIAEDERVLAEPAPVIELGALGDSSVDFIVRPWVKATDYWQVLWDTNAKVKLRFDELGISIPYPQMDVHLDNTQAASE
ncbi:MAG: mechanosensitive ion channel domain-containing protein [Pseudomonadota bacterium]